MPSYMGAKSATGAYQAIIAQMPPHDTYIETHFGTGAVMRNKPRSRRSIAIELDKKTLRDFPPPEYAEVHQGDCHAFLRSFDFYEAGKTLVYADPPYVPSTRTSKKKYRKDYKEGDHLDLIDVLRTIDADVILSGYPNELYDRLLGDWRTIEFQVMTRGGSRTECLWLNFDPGKVQWATFAGANFTDRQRIKRKADRWRANYEALPPGERLAILGAILELHQSDPQIEGRIRSDEDWRLF